MQREIAVSAHIRHSSGFDRSAGVSSLVARERRRRIALLQVCSINSRTYCRARSTSAAAYAICLPCVGCNDSFPRFASRSTARRCFCGRRKRCWVSSEAELWLHETVVEGFGQTAASRLFRDGCLLVASGYQSVFLARGCSGRTACSTRARGDAGARLRMARRPQGNPRWADVYRSGSSMVEVRYQHEVRQQSGVGVCGLAGVRSTVVWRPALLAAWGIGWPFRGITSCLVATNRRAL